MAQTKKIFSIKDTKAEAYNQPFFTNSLGEAERMFHSARNDEKTTINKYPEDFDLYFLGEYDDETGKLLPLDTPQHIVKAANIPTRE